MKISKKVLNTIICPGYGWTGITDELNNISDEPYEPFLTCPSCRYQIGIEPWRLLTVRELLSDKMSYIDYDQVRFDLFLKSLFKLLEVETE